MLATPSEWDNKEAENMSKNTGRTASTTTKSPPTSLLIVIVVYGAFLVALLLAAYTYLLSDNNYRRCLLAIIGLIAYGPIRIHAATNQEGEQWPE